MQVRQRPLELALYVRCGITPHPNVDGDDGDVGIGKRAQEEWEW